MTRSLATSLSAGLLLLTAAAGSTSAQQNGPPPVPILPEARQDTARALPDTATKRESLPPLALPDIVVFGRSGTTVREGSKLFPAEKRTVLDREVAAPEGEKGISGAGLGGGRQLAVRERIPGPNRARLFTRLGTYGEAIGGLDFWRYLNRTQLITRIEVRGTGGHTEQSAALGGAGRLSVVHPLSAFTDLRVRAGYGIGRQQEWSALAPTDAERVWYRGSYSADLESMPTRGLTLSLGAGGRHAGLTDEVRVPGTVLEPASNGGWASAGLEWMRGRVLITARGEAERDLLRRPGEDQDVSLASARLGVRTLTGEAGSFMLGAALYHVDAGLGPATRVWPVAEFTSQYSERFSMFARYEPHMYYDPLGEAREENPFAASSFKVVPSEERFHLTVGVHYALTPRTTLRFEVGRRLYDRLPFWRPAPATDIGHEGLFVLGQRAGAALSETRVTLEGRPGPVTVFDGEVILRVPGGEGIQEIPHMARFEASGGLEVQGPWSIGLETRLRYLGERYSTVSGDPASRIEPAADLGVRASRALSGGSTLWLELRNILDQEMVLWQGYPLPGRTLALGISVRF
ncbi:MAG: hypothetical protein R6W82_02745 [bacterium]